MGNSLTQPLSSADLQFILDRSEDTFRTLKNHRFLITGGTGLLGKWLLSSLEAANLRHGIDTQATVISRNPEAFLDQYDHFRTFTSLKWVRGDLKSLFFRDLPHVDTLIHLAGEVATDADPVEAAETARKLVEWAERGGASRVLFVSSGAVYGRIPADVTHIREEHAPHATEVTPYGHGKQECERIFTESSLDTRIARTFAVVGPYLPLDASFAIGNFIRDGRAGLPIQITGDGTPTRSYLHLAEHTHWLWTILSRGSRGRAYNVGSGESLTIREVAEVCGEIFGVPVVTEKTAVEGAPTSRYVPDVSRAATELGLKVEIPLWDAIGKTARWMD